MIKGEWLGEWGNFLEELCFVKKEEGCLCWRREGCRGYDSF